MTKLDKDLIIFDLDGTLTKSKSPIDPDMADLINKLIAIKKVAIISGGGYPQFQEQLISKLPTKVDNYSNLLLLPTSGTRLYSWKGLWQEQYAENLSQKEKEEILYNLNSVLKATGFEKPEKLFGDLIEDRGSQITFSALGQKAPVDLKYAWDPTREKRDKIASMLSSRIPEFDVRVGGATSIDITRKGVNKAYGINKLEQYLKIPISKMLFVGDALFYGGNDYPAKTTGVDCIAVKGPEETSALIQSWVNSN
jgi:HAD superfamily hydrolase (TIGR01484 family)